MFYSSNQSHILMSELRSIKCLVWFSYELWSISPSYNWTIINCHIPSLYMTQSHQNVTKQQCRIEIRYYIYHRTIFWVQDPLYLVPSVRILQVNKMYLPILSWSWRLLLQISIPLSKSATSSQSWKFREELHYCIVQA